MPPVQPLQFNVPTTQATQKPGEGTQKSSDTVFKNTFTEVKKQQASLTKEASASAKSANASSSLKSINKTPVPTSNSTKSSTETEANTGMEIEDPLDLTLLSPASDMLMLVNDAAMHLQKSDAKLSNVPTVGNKTEGSKTDLQALSARETHASDMLTNKNSISDEPRLTQSVDPEIKAVETTSKPVKELDVDAKPSAEFATTIQSTMSMNATMTKEISKVAQTEIAPRVGQPGWGEAVGQKVLWMVTDSIQSATLTLNPPDLGPVEIVLNVENDQATASFTAAHLETQQALESALPKLRDMMESAGVKLGETTVNLGFSQGQPDSGQNSDKKNAPQSDSSWSALAAEPAEQPAVLVTGSGLINTYA